MHGVEALDGARLLGHRCDHPMCQRVAANHVVVSSAALCRTGASGRSGATPPTARWRIRVGRVGGHGSCATWARQDPELVAADLERLRLLLGEPLTLW